MASERAVKATGTSEGNHVLRINPSPPAVECVLASAVTPGLWSARMLTVPSALRLAPERMFVAAAAVPVVVAVELVLAPTPLASQVAFDEKEAPSVDSTRMFPPVVTCVDAPISAVAGSLTVVVACASESPTTPPLEASATQSMPVSLVTGQRIGSDKPVWLTPAVLGTNN